MKKLILAVTLAFLFSCNYGPTAQQKAEALIKQYMLKTLTYPANYQSIKFGKLDSVFSNHQSIEDYQLLNERIDSLEMLKKFYRRINTAFAKLKLAHLMIESDRYDQKLIALTKQGSIRESVPKDQFTGWSLIHEFRGREGKSIIKASCIFTFDKNVEYITDVQYN